MKNYTSLDGLLLATISCNRKTANFEDWISTMDYIDRSTMSYEEIETSLGHLIAGSLLDIKDNKYIITKKGKKILSSVSSWFIGVIDWQIQVRQRIVLAQYDETKLGLEKFTNKQDYDNSFEKYNTKMQKELDKMKIENDANKQKKKDLKKYMFYVLGSAFFLIFLLVLCVGYLSSGLIEAGFSMVIFNIYFIVFSYCLNAYKNLKQGKSIKGYKLLFNKESIIANIIVLCGNITFFIIMSFFMWQYVFAICFLISYVVFIFVLFSYIIKDKKPKKNIATKRYVAKVYGESYYMNGVDVLNPENREELNGYSIALLHPITKNIWRKQESIYRIEGKNFAFYIALISYEKSINIIYFLTYKDKMKISSEIHNDYICEDYEKNYDVQLQYLQNIIEKQAKENEKYSINFLSRTRIESVNETFKVYCEISHIDESLGRDTFDGENNYDYLINSEFKISWIEVECFDCNDFLEAEDKSKKYLERENL